MRSPGFSFSALAGASLSPILEDQQIKNDIFMVLSSAKKCKKLKHNILCKEAGGLVLPASTPLCKWAFTHYV